MASVGPLLVLGAVEVRQDVTGTLAQGPPELRSSVSTAGAPWLNRLDQLRHQCAPVGVPVGRERVPQPPALLVGAQVGAGVQGSPGGVAGAPLRPRCPRVSCWNRRRH